MRFWIALLIFVSGLTSSAVGFVNQLENQPIDVINASGSLTKPTSYVMIPNSVLSAYQGETSVFAIGDGAIFMSSARQSDLVAWLGDAPYVELRLNVDATNKKVSLAEIERPGQGTPADPVGSDIWKYELNSNGTALLPVTVDNEIAILIASTGVDLAPRTIRVSWDLGEVAAAVAPITLIGTGLMLVGALFGIYAAIHYGRKFRSRRNKRGPRKPKPIRARGTKSQAGPAPLTGRRAHRALKTAAVAGTISLLTGCVPNYENPIVSPSPLDQPGILTASLDRNQLDKILDDLDQVVSTADLSLDRESLEVRMAGPALEMRRAAYALAAKTTDDPLDGPAPLTLSPIQLFLPSATDTWPRTAMVIAGDGELVMMLLRQDSPRDQYKLYQYSNLLPGITFPEVPAESLGANALKADNKFLSMDPASLVEGLGNLLNQGENSPWTLLIDPDNQYVSEVSSVQLGLQETLSNANLDFKHQLAATDPVLLANSEGGALVALYMIDTYTIIPKEPGDAVAITGDEAVLLGTGGSATGIETSYGAMLLFNVPAAGSDARVSLLGASQQLLSAITLGG